MIIRNYKIISFVSHKDGQTGYRSRNICNDRPYWPIEKLLEFECTVLSNALSYHLSECRRDENVDANSSREFIFGSCLFFLFVSFYFRFLFFFLSIPLTFLSKKRIINRMNYWVVRWLKRLSTIDLNFEFCGDFVSLEEKSDKVKKGHREESVRFRGDLGRPA